MPGHASISQSYADYPRSTVNMTSVVRPPDKQDWTDVTVAKLNGGHLISVLQSRGDSRTTADPQCSPSRPTIPSSAVELQRRNGGNLRLYNNYSDLCSGVRASQQRRINERISAGLPAVDRILVDKYGDQNEKLEYQMGGHPVMRPIVNNKSCREERDPVVPYREVEKTNKISFDGPLDRLPGNDDRFDRRTMIMGEQCAQQSFEGKYRRRARTRDNVRNSDLRFDSPRDDITSSREFTGQHTKDYLTRDIDNSGKSNYCTSKNTYVCLSKSGLNECNVVDSKLAKYCKPYENVKRYLPTAIMKSDDRFVHHRTDDLCNRTREGDNSLKHRSSYRTENEQYQDRRPDCKLQESYKITRMTSDLPERQEIYPERSITTGEMARDRQSPLPAIRSDFIQECSSLVSYCADRPQVSRKIPRRNPFNKIIDDNRGSKKSDYFDDNPQEKRDNDSEDNNYCFETRNENMPMTSLTSKERSSAALDINSADQSDLFPKSEDIATRVQLTPGSRLPALPSDTLHTSSNFGVASIHSNRITIEHEGNERETLSGVNRSINNSSNELHSSTTYPGFPIEVNTVTSATQHDCEGDQTKKKYSIRLKTDLQGEDRSHSTNAVIDSEFDVRGSSESANFAMSPASELRTSVKDKVIDVKTELTTSPAALVPLKAPSCCSASSTKTTSSTTAKSPFKVIYYQNRFISVPIGNRVGSSDEDGVLPTVVQCGEGVSRGLEDLERVKESTVHYDPSDTKACPIVSVNKDKSGGGGLKYCLQRVVECLQDKDRTSVKRRTAKKERISFGSHTTRLVKFLNIGFMTTGLVLFFGVFFVIMYTSLKKYFV